MLKYQLFGSRKDLVDFVNVNKIPRQFIIQITPFENGLITLYYWEEEI